MLNTKEINIILESAKPLLRKWCSNTRELLRNIGKFNSDSLFILQISVDDIVKSLELS